MTTFDDFLKAVIDYPDDDGPRLACADWLFDNGDVARSEFIRFQCEREKLTCALDAEDGKRADSQAVGLGQLMAKGFVHSMQGVKCRRCELDARADELFCAMHEPEYGFSGVNGAFWARPLQDYLGMSGTWAFRRGFVERIEATWPVWREYAGKLVTLTPLRRVRLTTRPYRVSTGLTGNPIVLLDGTINSGFQFADEGDVGKQVRRLLAERYGDRIEFSFDVTPPSVRAFGFGNRSEVTLEAGEHLRPGDMITADSQGRAVRAHSGVGHARVLGVND